MAPGADAHFDPCTAPRLFSFGSSEAETWAWSELVVCSGTLALLASPGRDQPPCTPLGPPSQGTGLRPGEWHTVVVTHEYARLGASTVTVVMDDQVVLRRPLKYPAPRDREGTLWLGTDAAGHAFQGLMEGVYFFKEPLQLLSKGSAYASACAAAATHKGKVLCALHAASCAEGVC